MDGAKIVIIGFAAMLAACEYSGRAPKFQMWQMVTRKIDGAQCQIVREPQGSIHYATYAYGVRCQPVRSTDTHLIGRDGPIQFAPVIDWLYEEELQANG